MQREREDVLARSRFALEQNRDVTSSGPLEEREHVPHRGAMRDRISEARTRRDADIEGLTRQANGDGRFSQGEHGVLAEHQLAETSARIMSPVQTSEIARSNSRRFG